MPAPKKELVKIYHFDHGNFGGVKKVAEMILAVHTCTCRYPEYDMSAAQPLRTNTYRWVKFEGGDYPITPGNELFLANKKN